MILILKKEHQEINPEIKESLDNLEEGKYLLTIQPIHPKSNKEYQAHYFLMIDIVRNHTGNDRYTIHNDFKANQRIESTKNFSVDDWVLYLNDFRWWIFEKFDLAI